MGIWILNTICNIFLLCRDVGSARKHQLDWRHMKGWRIDQRYTKNEYIIENNKKVQPNWQRAYSGRGMLRVRVVNRLWQIKILLAGWTRGMWMDEHGGWYLCSYQVVKEKECILEKTIVKGITCGSDRRPNTETQV